MKMGNWNRSFTVVQECKIDGKTTANNIVATLTTCSAIKTGVDPARTAAKRVDSHSLQAAMDHDVVAGRDDPKLPIAAGSSSSSSQNREDMCYNHPVCT